MTRRRGRRRKKLLDDLKDRRGYCQLKEEALDRTMWRNRFIRGFGPVVWQITDDDDDNDDILAVYLHIWNVISSKYFLFVNHLLWDVHCRPKHVTVLIFLDYKQQDVTIFDYLFLKGSKCFGRFLRPSSGAHNSTHSFRCCQPVPLAAGIVDHM